MILPASILVFKAKQFLVFLQYHVVIDVTKLHFDFEGQICVTESLIQYTVPKAESDFFPWKEM